MIIISAMEWNILTFSQSWSQANLLLINGVPSRSSFDQCYWKFEYSRCICWCFAQVRTETWRNNGTGNRKLQLFFNLSSLVLVECIRIIVIIQLPSLIMKASFINLNYFISMVDFDVQSIKTRLLNLLTWIFAGKGCSTGKWWSWSACFLLSRFHGNT